MSLVALASVRCVSKLKWDKCAKHTVYLLKEQQIKIRGRKINYLKVGDGKQAVLWYPGLLGTIWTHFKPQVDFIDRMKLTSIFWEPPGQGFSEGKNIQFTLDSQDEVLYYAIDLMNELGYKQFSLVGWCLGGTSALFIAAQFQKNIQKLVIWSTLCYVGDYELKAFQKMKNYKNWDIDMRLPMSVIYSKGVLTKVCNTWYDNILDIYENREGNVCKAVLPHIQCPTLILAAKTGSMISAKQIEYMAQNIKGSELVYFDTGHSLHLKYPHEFNKIVTKFLIKEPST